MHAARNQFLELLSSNCNTTTRWTPVRAIDGGESKICAETVKVQGCGLSHEIDLIVATGATHAERGLWACSSLVYIHWTVMRY